MFAKTLKPVIFACIVAISCAAVPSWAVTPQEAESMTDEELLNYVEEIYGTTKETTPLRSVDRQGLKIANEYKSGHATAATPSRGPAGAITFIYGAAQPRVLCRPLRVTDIALQPGERVTGAPLVGDAVNWEVLPSTSGPEDNLTIHVMVKPHMPDLATNLTIHTDRRTYLIDLVSTDGKQGFYPYVSFTYPEYDNKQAWARLDERLTRIQAARAAAEEEEKALVPTPSAVSTSLNYKFSGRATISWFPKAAWNDAEHVYILFPRSIKGREMPVFQTLRGKTRELTNYRVMANGEGLIIDNLFKRGVLSVGSDVVYIEVKTPEAPVILTETQKK